MKIDEEVQAQLTEALKAGLNQKLSPQDEDYKRVSVEALCEQFVGACYTLGGGDPDLLSAVFKEHSEKAMAIIVMVVEAVSLLPEGGVSTRDLWERIMKAVDEL